MEEWLKKNWPIVGAVVGVLIALYFLSTRGTQQIVVPAQGAASSDTTNAGAADAAANAAAIGAQRDIAVAALGAHVAETEAYYNYRSVLAAEEGQVARANAAVDAQSSHDLFSTISTIGGYLLGGPAGGVLSRGISL